MKKEFSIYLDAVRFLAACLVVIFHSNQRNIVSDILPASNWGHAAVIVFFVLSGYVIAYITCTQENTLKTYAASRLSRIYSMAIPAIVLAIVLDTIGESLTPAFYVAKTTHDHGLLRVITSLLFVNEFWKISIMSFSNWPYWSLCYEVWYYVLFAVWVFARGRRRVVIFSAICLMVGPKVLLLAPIWILGVVLYRWRGADNLPESLAWLLFLLSTVGIVVFTEYKLVEYFSGLLQSWIGAYWLKELSESKGFIGDYLLAGLVFVNFMAFNCISHRFSLVFGLVGRPVRFLAGYTFSIYIFHQPLILFWAAVFNMSPVGYSLYMRVMIATALSILALCWLIERHRIEFKKWVLHKLTRAESISAVRPLLGAVSSW